MIKITEITHIVRVGHVKEKKTFSPSRLSSFLVIVVAKMLHFAGIFFFAKCNELVKTT